MAAALIFGVDVVAGMLTLGYIGKLLFTGEEFCTPDTFGSMKKSLLNQNICRKAR